MIRLFRALRKWPEDAKVKDNHEMRNEGGGGGNLAGQAFLLFFFMFFLNSADPTISAGKSYLLQPRPQVDFSWLWRWAPHLQSQGKATWGRGFTCNADHEPIITDQVGGRGYSTNIWVLGESLRVETLTLVRKKNS